MTDETCPLCHDGMFVRMDEKLGLRSKRFSCGHRLEGQLILAESLALAHSLAMKDQLGPQSAETFSHTGSYDIDIILVSMQQEMYADALHFYIEAKANQAKTGEPFVMWRNLRAAILFSCAAIEACINQFIDSHVEKNKGSMTPAQFRFWTNRGRRRPSIVEKLNEGVELFGPAGSRLDSDPALWRDFKELKKLRNGLVHYKVRSGRDFYNEELPEKVKKGIITTSGLIKKIYLAHPDNRSYPPVFDKIP
jgi:hypothetical protein